jgi:Protein of unknown function (DUF3263)
MPLSDRDRFILELERAYQGRTDEKHVVVFATYGWLPLRYRQVLNAIIDDPAAIVYDPELVYRLRRLRGRHRARRPARAAGFTIR